MIENATTATGGTTGQRPPEAPHRVGMLTILLFLAASAALGVLIYRGIDSRVSAESKLVKETHASAALDVAVTHPKRASGNQDTILPGNMQPFSDAPIYARTN